jgi:hypothetical protein
MGGAMDGEFYVPDGVYSYTISANSSKAGERFEYRGYISIIR